MKQVGLLIILLISLFTAMAQSKQVRGKVTDKSSGKPLPDVSIIIKGTTIGTRTDEAGNFTLPVNQSGKVDLEISLINYGTQQITTDGTAPLNIVLDREAKSLDEVVVIGYGTVKKRDVTGAVVSVKNDEIKKVASPNVMESVQGKVAGVDIVRTSGAAGANVAVTVRGTRSIIAGNGPLYIVDGIQYSNYQDINPNDIESMEVLKDASSTAIYGSRGANGVIIITTKKGNSGKPKISANAYYGVNDVAGYPVPMTGPQFAELKRQAYRTSGTWNSVADDSKIFTPTELAAVQNGTSTYWPGMLLNKGSQQDYGVGVSSGNEKTKVYFSFDYNKEKGLLNNDYSSRYTVRLNIDQAITNTFKVGLQSQLTYYDQNLRADNILTVANKVLPYFVPYDSTNNLVKYPGSGAQLNPLLEELPGAYINKNNITRILSTAYGEWRPLKGLSIRSNLGVTNSSVRNGSFEDANTISRALSSGSISRVNNTGETNITWENILNYQKRFGSHNIGITGVTSYLSSKSDNSSASGTGQLLPSQSFYALQNNPANVVNTSSYTQSNLISGAFRFNYSYKEKYLLTVTGREDGASVLGTKNHWAFFPSVAAAWRLSDEGFMKGQSLFNDLKLRVSYGVAGNSAVSPYQTQSTLMLIPFQWNDQSQLAYGLNPQTGNPDLKWELTANENIGVDFAILKSRITGSLDYYDAKTSDLLLLRQLPPTSGVSKILQNIGKTRNNGFEIAINSTNIQSKNFRWDTRLTYTRNKERIVELVGNQSDIGNKWIIGYPVRSFYDYQKIGIWQTADSAEARSYGYKPGDIKVADLNSDKRITATDDRTVVGSAVPKYSFGFSNDFKLGSFDLNVYVFGRIGQMFTSDYANKFEPNAIENGANVNYWTPENPTNDYPRPNVNLSRAALPFATTLGYLDGSFVKIRNITLGYNLPSTFAKRLGISNLRVYVSAKNYFSFAKVKDYDPEGSGSFDRPLTKLLLTGLNIDL
jgi:TonB-dependent starch-binding outer membrane protein SusC